MKGSYTSTGIQNFSEVKKSKSNKKLYRKKYIYYSTYIIVHKQASYIHGKIHSLGQGWGCFFKAGQQRNV